MKRLSIMILSLFTLSMVGCDRVSEMLNPEKETNEIMVGAYSKQRRLTEEQRAMFYRVTESLSDRVEYKPMNVGVQVVAGTNYRFLCKGRELKPDGSRGEKIYAEIIIHQPLPGQGEPRIISISRQRR